MKVLTFAEHEAFAVPSGALSMTQADAIWARYAGQIEVREPSRQTNGAWELRSDGWVGVFPVAAEPAGLTLHVLPKVPIRSVFALWDYALNLGTFLDDRSVTSMDTLQDVYQLLARALAYRMIRRSHIGLLKAYRKVRQPLAAMRGRLDMPRHLRRIAPATIDCSYQVHTSDFIDNQIPYWALAMILRSGMCDEQVTHDVRHAFSLLRSHVTQQPCSALDCIGRSYDRQSEDYRAIHALSRFFLESSGPTQNAGDKAMVPFQIDMARLFEAGVAAWLHRHLPPELRLNVQDNVLSGGESFRIDLVITDTSGRALCVLDTKYKHANKSSPDDRHQIVSYAELKGCPLGVLIYPEATSRSESVAHGSKTVARMAFDLQRPIDEAGLELVKQLKLLLEPVQV